MSSEELNVRFWPAFEALVDEAIEEKQLGYAYGFKAPCGERFGACDLEALSRAIRQQIGREDWPVAHREALTDREIVNLVEFFAGSVVYPDLLMCNYCERDHITFGRPARDDFRAAVNVVFTNLGLPFQFTEQGVRHQRSAILSRDAEEVALLTSDLALADLLRRAVSDFLHGGEDRRLTGLRTIVDAFERTKALLGTNKRVSIDRLVRQMAVDEQLVEPLDQMFRRLSDIGNKYSIRHHEPSQQPLDDPALVEYLFYSYLNLVRFSLTKLQCSGT
ncbi:MAG TPA: hypothetical protein VF713_11470 [Thermoanaerobaculia bacterium]